MTGREPSSNLNQTTLISTDAIRASVPDSCNACRLCHVTLPAGRKKFCCKKHATLFRVREHRKRQEPLRKPTARGNDDYQSRRRSAVTDCVAGTTLLRDVGRDTAAIRERELQARQRQERQRLRA